MIQTRNAKNLIKAAQATKTIFQGHTMSQIAISLIVSGSFSLMVSIIDQLQIIIHLPILNILVPANAMQFFSTAVPIVTYDILENYDLYNDFIKYLTRSGSTAAADESKTRRLQKFQELESKKILRRITDQTWQLGYDSYNPLMNLGTLSLLILIFAFKIIFTFTVLWLLSKCFPRLK